jgi:hypothetical protein
VSSRCRENTRPGLFSRLGRVPRATLAALLALALAAGFAGSGCGEEDAQLLPGGTAREITANLDTVQQLADEGDCLGAESAALQVSEQVEALTGVDERLKRALREGATRLNEVVAECEEATEAPDVVAPPVEEESERDAEKQEMEEEKREKEEEKEAEREEAEGDEGDDEGESEPSLPPQAEGEGKGFDEGEGGGPGGGGGAPSGGVSPANPAGGGD